MHCFGSRTALELAPYIFVPWTYNLHGNFDVVFVVVMIEMQLYGIIDASAMCALGDLMKKNAGT